MSKVWSYSALADNSYSEVLSGQLGWIIVAVRVDWVGEGDPMRLWWMLRLEWELRLPSSRSMPLRLQYELKRSWSISLYPSVT